MSYQAAYKALLQYEPKELTAEKYISEDGCKCAVAVACPLIEDLIRMNMGINDTDIECVYDDFHITDSSLNGLTISEAKDLQLMNDSFLAMSEEEYDSPKQERRARYIYILEYLQRRCQKEKSQIGTLPVLLLFLGMAISLVPGCLSGRTRMPLESKIEGLAIPSPSPMPEIDYKPSQRPLTATEAECNTGPGVVLSLEQVEQLGTAVAIKDKYILYLDSMIESSCKSCSMELGKDLYKELEEQEKKTKRMKKMMLYGIPLALATGFILAASFGL